VGNPKVVSILEIFRGEQTLFLSQIVVIMTEKGKHDGDLRGPA
jgi:hypothetical protein